MRMRRKGKDSRARTDVQMAVFLPVIGNCAGSHMNISRTQAATGRYSFLFFISISIEIHSYLTLIINYTPYCSHQFHITDTHNPSNSSPDRARTCQASTFHSKLLSRPSWSHFRLPALMPRKRRREIYGLATPPSFPFLVVESFPAPPPPPAFPFIPLPPVRPSVAFTPFFAPDR